MDKGRSFKMFTVKYYEHDLLVREHKRIRTKFAAEKIGQSWFDRKPEERKVLIENSDGTFKVAITNIK